MIELEDIAPCVPCEVVMERRGDTFAVKIVGNSGELQKVDDYTILDGDVLSVTGLGFKVTFDGIEWKPPIPEKSNGDCVLPSITLKRKMDIDK